MGTQTLHLKRIRIGLNLSQQMLIGCPKNKGFKTKTVTSTVFGEKRISKIILGYRQQSWRSPILRKQHTIAFNNNNNRRNL